MEMTIEQLRLKGAQIRERLLKYENDLKQPMKRDLDDNAVEESSREIIYGLYKVEKENLLKIEEDILELSN